MGEVTTPTPRPNVRLSTFALLMEPVVWPSTASCVPTEPSSTRTTSSATGGSTSTVLRLRDFTLSMTRLPPSVRPLPLLLTPSDLTPLPTTLPLEVMTLPEMSSPTLRLLTVRLPGTLGTDVDPNRDYGPRPPEEGEGRVE